MSYIEEAWDANSMAKKLDRICSETLMHGGEWKASKKSSYGDYVGEGVGLYNNG